MQHALELAKYAQQQGEVPVGAVVYYDDKIVGEGWNSPIGSKDPTAHAEINALRAAATTLNNYRLVGCTLYVTLEPCLMCVGAILHARIARVVFGADDPKAGAMTSKMKLTDSNPLNIKLQWQGGVLAHECGEILKNFFRDKR